VNKPLNKLSSRKARSLHILVVIRREL
jgi:hypothetical protein